MNPEAASTPPPSPPQQRLLLHHHRCTPCGSSVQRPPPSSPSPRTHPKRQQISLLTPPHSSSTTTTSLPVLLHSISSRIHSPGTTVATQFSLETAKTNFRISAASASDSQAIGVALTSVPRPPHFHTAQENGPRFEFRLSGGRVEQGRSWSSRR
ncbi:hypothetical protein Acr_17g0012510 [Actinidia rufa]|uniref:Uncharacterized protein n=1 Tax=Actinidia rufa TaxID=165716 RepID=A0A7J0G4I7_9ERIC|nr:hypothetical protein Acr_17g0012510 [Actinidia rufa]